VGSCCIYIVDCVNELKFFELSPIETVFSLGPFVDNMSIGSFRSIFVRCDMRNPVVVGVIF
jgi:hypothetical protein